MNVTNQPRWRKVCAIKALEPDHDPLLLNTLTDEELTDYLLDIGLEIIAVRRELPPFDILRPLKGADPRG